MRFRQLRTISSENNTYIRGKKLLFTSNVQATEELCLFSPIKQRDRYVSESALHHHGSFCPYKSLLNALLT